MRVEITLVFFLQNGLLQELAEEWERCEKKLKDAGHWLDATSRTLEAPQNAKKPLRDRLALREKLINDISTQKTKISYAVEKLNVSLCLNELISEYLIAGGRVNFRAALGVE